MLHQRRRPINNKVTMANKSLLLRVLAHDSSYEEKDVSEVIFPGVTGSFAILCDHAPLMAALKEGEIVYVIGEERKSKHIKSGFVEVNKNIVTVCVEE